MGSQLKKLRRKGFARVRAGVGSIVSSCRSKHLSAEGCWFDPSDNSIGWLTQQVPDGERIRYIARCIRHPRTELPEREFAREMRNIHSQTDAESVEHWTLYASPTPWGGGVERVTKQDWESFCALVERLSYDTGERRERELPPVECSDGTHRIVAFTWHSDATDVEVAVRRQLKRQIDGMVDRMDAPVPPAIPLRPAVIKS